MAWGYVAAPVHLGFTSIRGVMQCGSSSIMSQGSRSVALVSVELVSPDSPGRDVLYRYSARHDASAVDAMPAGDKGYLVAEAHAVYVCLANIRPAEAHEQARPGSRYAASSYRWWSPPSRGSATILPA